MALGHCNSSGASLSWLRSIRKAKPKPSDELLIATIGPRDHYMRVFTRRTHCIGQLACGRGGSSPDSLAPPRSAYEGRGRLARPPDPEDSPGVFHDPRLRRGD